MATTDFTRLINHLDRSQLVALLESYGYTILDEEPTSALREEIRISINDGTIEVEHLEVLADEVMA